MKHEHDSQHDSRIETAAEAHEREGFEVRDADADTLAVVEFERAPLTDVNFGF